MVNIYKFPVCLQNILALKITFRLEEKIRTLEW